MRCQIVGYIGIYFALAVMLKKKDTKVSYKHDLLS